MNSPRLLEPFYQLNPRNKLEVLYSEAVSALDASPDHLIDAYCGWNDYTE